MSRHENYSVFDAGVNKLNVATLGYNISFVFSFSPNTSYKGGECSLTILMGNYCCDCFTTTNYINLRFMHNYVWCHKNANLLEASKKFQNYLMHDTFTDITEQHCKFVKFKQYVMY